MLAVHAASHFCHAAAGLLNLFFFFGTAVCPVSAPILRMNSQDTLSSQETQKPLFLHFSRLGRVCSHSAAVCFAVDFWTQVNTGHPAPTDLPCQWVQPRPFWRILRADFSSRHFRRSRQRRFSFLSAGTFISSMLRNDSIRRITTTHAATRT